LIRPYRLLGRDPYVNLSSEEALLEAAFSDDPLFLVYVDDACCVIGRNQNPWAELSTQALSPGSGIPVLRRVSGGGTVYHDAGNLNWSFIVPREAHDREAELGLVASALAGIGIDAAEGDRGGLYLASGPFRGRKISGTARRFSAKRVLHHGTLLVDADLGRLSSCLGGLAIEASRALPSVSASAVNLASLRPGLRLDEVALALARSICGAEPEHLGLAEFPSLASADHRGKAEARLRSWDWTWAQTPPFSWGQSPRVEVRAGLVSAVVGPGADQLPGLVGRKFDFELSNLLREVLEKNAVYE
jgi:Lipoate-protein ligase A